MAKMRILGKSGFGDLRLSALVVKLADTYALGAYAARRRGSNPLEGTQNKRFNL